MSGSSPNQTTSTIILSGSTPNQTASTLALSGSSLTLDEGNQESARGPKRRKRQPKTARAATAESETEPDLQRSETNLQKIAADFANEVVASNTRETEAEILPNEIIFKNPLNYRNNNSVSKIKESPLVVKKVARYETSSSSEIQSIELLDIESRFSTDSDVICGENCSRSFSRNGDPTDSDVICSRNVDPSQIDMIDPVLTTDIQVCAPY